jgi:REP element-mobilizing transposase RayT
MARVPRTSLPDGYFHVHARAVAAAGALYRDETDRATFVDLLRRTSGRFGWTCHALCLMSTHYHVVLESSCARLSAGMEQLNWQYARYFNTRHGFFGHVFAERFSARWIDDEQYLFEACAYVTLNPVRAGLCSYAEDWPWSWSAVGLHAS